MTREGGHLTFHGPQARNSIYDCGDGLRREGTPFIVFAGEEYGTGSSRDWAANEGSAPPRPFERFVAKQIRRIHTEQILTIGHGT